MSDDKKVQSKFESLISWIIGVIAISGLWAICHHYVSSQTPTCEQNPFYCEDVVSEESEKSEQKKQRYINDLKIEQTKLLVILDDKIIDKKEGELLQKIIKKITTDYEPSQDSSEIEFMKPLKRFDDVGYTEVVNTNYKSSVNVYFNQWIEAEQEGFQL